MIDAVATALINGIWQGILLTTVAATLMRNGKNFNSTTRYIAWTSALAACALFFVFAPLLVGLHYNWSRSSAGALHLPLAPVLEIPLLAAECGLALWMGFAVVLVVRVLRAFINLSEVVTNAHPIKNARLEALIESAVGRHRRPSALLVSADVHFPVAVGVISPAIVLPAEAFQSLTPSQLDQVVMHELAHIERWDDWSKFVQRVLQAVFFFHPAVQYIGGRLDLERELACDDWVISSTGKRKDYADTLVTLAQTVPAIRPAVPALGLVSTKRHLMLRVQQILSSTRDAMPRYTATGRAATAFILFVAIFLIAQTFPVIARSVTSSNMTSSCKSCNMARASWHGLRLVHANFSSSNLPYADFGDAVIPRAEFKSANLLGANFRRADLRGADFSYANLTNADLRDADLRNANFFEARTRGAILVGAKLDGTNLP